MVCNVVPEVAVTLPNVGAVIVPQEFALQLGAAVQLPVIVQVRIAAADSVKPWLHTYVLVCIVVPVVADAVPKLGAVINPHE